MFHWKKLGLIFEPAGRADWLKSHAWVPTPDDLGDGYFRVYFAGRNSNNLSQVGAFTINVEKPNEILDFSVEPIVQLGDLGLFDDSAVIPSCIVTDGGCKRLFYIGWMQGKRVPFYAMIGTATSRDNGKTFQKTSPAPYFSRSDIDPYFMAASYVLKDSSDYKMWYTTNTAWRETSGETLPKYHIKFAHSSDGEQWIREGRVSIDFLSNDEYAISRPWVLKEDGLYRMWYSFRGKTYRIGYAESEDGVSWERMDDASGIDISNSGFDSEMIEYAAVVQHNGQHFMFYNGNNFGADGIGLAIEE